MTCLRNKIKCHERDSNPHSLFGPRDFKSLVSTNSTMAASFSKCKGTAKTLNYQKNLVILIHI